MDDSSVFYESPSVPRHQKQREEEKKPMNMSHHIALGDCAAQNMDALRKHK